MKKLEGENVGILTEASEVAMVERGEYKSKCSFLLANLTGESVSVMDSCQKKMIVIPPVKYLLKARDHGYDGPKQGGIAFAGTGILIETPERRFVAGLPQTRQNGVYYIVTESVAEASYRNGRDVADLLIPCSDVQGYEGFRSLASADVVAVGVTSEMYRCYPK